MWEVQYSTKKIKKQAENLPRRAADALDTLMDELRDNGPVRGNWPNYGKLADGSHHCHLKGGHPTYVACWKEDDKGIQIIRITYVGTHENAPY